MSQPAFLTPSPALGRKNRLKQEETERTEESRQGLSAFSVASCSKDFEVHGPHRSLPVGRKNRLKQEETEGTEEARQGFSVFSVASCSKDSEVHGPPRSLPGVRKGANPAPPG